MAIIVNLDVMMAKRKITLGDLADRIGITPANLSILKTGKAKAIRFLLLRQFVRSLVVNRQIYSNLKKMNSLFKGFIDCLLTMCKCID